LNCATDLEPVASSSHPPVPGVHRPESSRKRRCCLWPREQQGSLPQSSADRHRRWTLENEPNPNGYAGWDRLANLGLPYSFCYETCAGAFIKYQRDEQQLQLLPFEFEIRVQLKRATGLRKGFTRNSLFRASLLAARTAAPYFFSQGKHQASSSCDGTNRPCERHRRAGALEHARRTFRLKVLYNPAFFLLFHDVINVYWSQSCDGSQC
jgi:hypothetical protein